MKMWSISHTIFIVLFSKYVCTQVVIRNETFLLPSIPEDGHLLFMELAVKYGHDCERHELKTEDGYNLTLFNIPGNKSRAVFLLHGFVDSADTFIIRGNTSLAIALADEGYDVWAGNQRGNRYSKIHDILDTDDREYWNFTLHELATIDLPLMIDYVLNATNQTQLQAIGHNQGNTLFYILGSEKQEYNDKVKLLIAMAPVLYLNNAQSLSKRLVKNWSRIGTPLRLTGQHEVFSQRFRNAATIFCSLNTSYETCTERIFFPLAGSDPEELEREFLPVVMGHYPDTTSIKNANHLEQFADRKRFSQYDFGRIRNLFQYRSINPPDYDLGSVTMPIALLAGKNDNFAALEDVERQNEELPNVVRFNIMDREQFNHINFVWGRNMPEYLFPLIFELLQNQNSTSSD